MKKVFFATIFFAGLSLIGLSLSSSKIAAYNPLDQACNTSASGSGVCQDASSQGDKNPVVEVINQGIRILGWVVGVTSVLLIMIGGFNYITSAGNPEKTASAKKRIIYALVGLVIAALAWVIVHFVTNRIL